MKFISTFKEKTDYQQNEHEKLVMLLNVTRNISREILLDRLLLLIMDEVKRVLDCDRCTVFIMDRERNELWSQVAHGAKEIRIPGDRGIAGHVAQTGIVLNIPDAYADDRFNPSIDKKTGYITRTILAVPMRNKMGEIIGVFQALNKRKGSFNNEDEELLNTISVIAATQIENAQLYKEQKKTFESLVETLASTIDARDPLTAGHSKRIAMYAENIAEIIGLSHQEKEILRIAALLHDLGKIAVREAVLTKEGKLTTKEFEHIQSHPRFTKRILDNINFSSALSQVPNIAAAHHERLDGSGYPFGLRDDQIPKLGKILAVVDVFDALTSKRHYRDRMEFDKVIKQLYISSGTHFEISYVDALLQFPLDKLVSIMEQENKWGLDEKHLAFLSSFTISDVYQALSQENPGDDQKELMSVFQIYYLREYLAESV
ncbi:GAF domain-containing protein [candidate division KSB1 bacterium]|nr:GAF domain-containing protein [candidate division KSB1 bacterium]